MCHDDLYHHLISQVMILDLIPWTLLAGAELAMPRGKLCLSQFLEVPVQTPQLGCQDSPTSSPADSNPSLGSITYQFVRITPIPISFLLHHCPESKSDREQISHFENGKTHRGEICLGIKVNRGAPGPCPLIFHPNILLSASILFFKLLFGLYCLPCSPPPRGVLSSFRTQCKSFPKSSPAVVVSIYLLFPELPCTSLIPVGASCTRRESP